jgi:hypothetical protein
VSELSDEDLKLVTLARSARARTGAAQGAAVRDTDGRTYVATTVSLPSLQLTALQAAVAAAVSSGALGLEAAVVLGESSGGGESSAGGASISDEAGVAAVRDVAPQAGIHFADVAGNVVTS